VKLFLIAEVFILVLAMFLAVMRSLPGPVFFPIRALAVGYIDLFRGIPTVLVIYTLGFGAPALGEKRAEVAVLLGGGLLGARLHRVRRGGLSSGHRIDPRESERGGPFARASPAGNPCAS
jgi:polar amino acid transport system permease protein